MTRDISFPREYYSISHALLLIASKLLSIVAQTAEFTPSRQSCTSHTCMMRAENQLGIDFLPSFEKDSSIVAYMHKTQHLCSCRAPQ